MFGLMKNLIKDNSTPSETLTLGDLHAGCVVGFGFMPQKSVSGKRVPVAEVNSYMFDEDSFIAYRLINDTTDINLIVADEENPAGTYLALSQRIESRLFDSIFPGRPPQSWFSLKEGVLLDAKPPVLGAPQGWLTSRYTLAVATKGRFLEGDYRMRKPMDRTRLSREFDYVLLVDEDNEYAIEAEKYEDGMINVFATIYRPATDIGEIARAPKSLITSSVETIPHIPPSEAGKPVLVESTPRPAPAEAEKSVVQETVAKAAQPSEKIEPANDRADDESSLDAIAVALLKIKDEEERKEAEAKRAEETAIPMPAPEPIVTEPAEAKAPEEAKTAEPEAKVPEPEPIIKTAPADEISPSALKTAPEAEIKAAEPEVARLPESEVETPELKKAEEKPAVLETILTEPTLKEPVAFSEAEKADIITAITAPEPVAGIAAPEVAARSKFGRIQSPPQDQASSRPETLACDLKLAGRLIDEAQRNQIVLSELIRRVIDLPARVQDKVLIPFNLDDAETAELARRYNLSPTDGEAVKEYILEELRRFVGEKK